MITATEPRVTLDGRYSVSQTCLALGIHRNTLQRYTEQGLIKCGLHSGCWLLRPRYARHIALCFSSRAFSVGVLTSIVSIVSMSL